MTNSAPWDKHWIRFHPRNAGQPLGFVTFGYDESPLIAQAAVNEAGLFFDFNALPAKHEGPEGKPEGSVDLLVRMMGTCRTVAAAVELLQNWDLKWMSAAQMVLGDATGASAIFERNAVTYRGPADYQIGTNFRTSDTPVEKITCWRYKTCDAALGKKQPVSVDSVRALLEQTMPKGKETITWYSTLCDLKSQRIFLFRKGEFSKVVTLNLGDELAVGDRKIDMDTLMAQRAQPYSPPAP
jgi:hypothetical protein